MNEYQGKARVKMRLDSTLIKYIDHARCRTQHNAKVAYVIILRKRESLLCVLYISMLIMKLENDHMHELIKTISDPVQQLKFLVELKPPTTRSQTLCRQNVQFVLYLNVVISI